MCNKLMLPMYIKEPGGTEIVHVHHIGVYSCIHCSWQCDIIILKFVWSTYVDFVMLKPTEYSISIITVHGLKRWTTHFRRQNGSYDKGLLPKGLPCTCIVSYIIVH